MHHHHPLWMFDKKQAVFTCLGPDYDISSWLSVKENLGLDFPNVSIL